MNHAEIERERETLFNEGKVTRVDVFIIKFHIIPSGDDDHDDDNVERVTPFSRSPTFMIGREGEKFDSGRLENSLINPAG